MSKKTSRKERRLRAIRRLEDVEISVEEPCQVPWEQMTGDRLVRHCHVCDLNVYNFAGMSPEQILALVNQREGRLCAQFYAREDGTMTVNPCSGESNELMRGGLVVSAKSDADLDTDLDAD
ncbi:MAG TPA: hypothetical protein V6C88_09880 [Chroococcidiopsis sp.]